MSNRLSNATKKNRRKDLVRALEKFEELIPPEISLPQDKDLVDKAKEKLAYLSNNRRMEIRNSVFYFLHILFSLNSEEKF